jgi:hypothetical protein
MIRSVSVAVVLALYSTSSVQAIPVASARTPDTIVTQVRNLCGVGFHRGVSGYCVRNVITKCAGGWRLVGGRCIR